MTKSAKALILFAAVVSASFRLAAQIGTPEYVPVKIEQTEEPGFPPSLVEVGIKSGAASIAVAVDDNGKITDCLVTAYTHPSFAENALKALKKWKFEPALVHGSPRNSMTDITFRFEMAGVVLVTLTPLTYNELVHFQIFPNSMAFSACSLGQLDRIPTPKKIVTPDYPNRLARSSRGGHVSVEFYIDQEGHTRIPSVSKETNEANEELASIAITAVSQWEFEPPMMKGKPALVRARQDFDFKPPAAPPAPSGATPPTTSQSPFESRRVPMAPRAALAATAETQGFTIVSAHAYAGYSRDTLANGSFKPETYAFGNGTRWDIAMADPSMDNITFEQIAQTIAPALADQNYHPAKDPSSTDLLIVVYWGTTTGSADLSAGFAPLSHGGPGRMVVGGGIAELNDIRNARLLGFDFPSDAFSNPFKYDRYSVMDEIESNRYFVGLVAYDFQELWRHNVRKVLWVTRYSIKEHRNQFDVDLPEITKYASQFFGQDSKGFVVKKLKDGYVNVGAVKAIDSAGER